MKEITGYLIDRTTGLGISGKTVSFLNLAGSPVAAAVTGLTTGSKDALTASDGKFSAWWELSPGPVNVLVDASASEKKVRKHNEKAQLGWQWSSDISRLSRGVPEGVVRGFLSELLVSIPSGHTVRINTGAALFNGGMFSIENGYIEIAGTPNNNAAISSRYDLVTIRQYNENAAGQLAGSQTIIITEGTTSAVAPATPTGSDFKDIPLAVLSTAYLGSTKTVVEDKRFYGKEEPLKYVNAIDGVATGSILGSSYSLIANAVATPLKKDVTYDGYATIYLVFATQSSPLGTYMGADFSLRCNASFVQANWNTGKKILTLSDEYRQYSGITVNIPLVGITGITSFTLPIELAKTDVGGTPVAILQRYAAEFFLRQRQ